MPTEFRSSLRPRALQKVLAWTCIVSGLVLGGLAVWGTLSPGQARFLEQGPIMPPDSDVASLRSIESIVERVRSLSPEPGRPAVWAIYDIARRRFSACTPFFGPRQNWMLWGLGFFSPLRAAVTAPLLPRYSDCGLCDQTNGVFVLVATELGINARLVSMPGHTTAEAQWDGVWHVVDPHFDYFPGSFDPPAVAETLGKNPEKTAGVYAHLGERTVAATVDSYVQFAAGEGVRRDIGRLNSPRLVVIHQGAEIAKLVVPILFLVVGFGIFRNDLVKKRNV